MKSILTAFIGLLAAVMVANADMVSDLRPAIKAAAEQNGVDPVLMEAIIRLESGHATSVAARTKNNLAGIMGRKGQRSYASKEECVQHLGRILGSYKARGRVTVAQIGRAYSTSRGVWASRVTNFITLIRSGRYGDISVYTPRG